MVFVSPLVYPSFIGVADRIHPVNSPRPNVITSPCFREPGQTTGSNALSAANCGTHTLSLSGTPTVREGCPVFSQRRANSPDFSPRSIDRLTRPIGRVCLLSLIRRATYSALCKPKCGSRWPRVASHDETVFTGSRIKTVSTWTRFTPFDPFLLFVEE